MGGVLFERRVHPERRARAIRLLGLPPEDPSNPYVATTRELERIAEGRKAS